MAKPTLHDFVAARIADRKLGQDDVITLRRYIYIDMTVSLEEGEALFRLNNAGLDCHDDWYDFFPEAVGDILIHQARPQGYVSEEHADWLIGQITANGHVCTKTELDAVLHVLEKARQVPDVLQQFALKAVADSVITGKGATRSGAELVPGVIADGEVELLRRVLYAGSGSRGTAISREEAEVLFDVNDATKEAENAPAWSELFAKAVGNYVMAMSGFTPPPRKVALARENWLNQPGGFEGGLRGFFKKMMAGNGGGIRDAFEDGPDPAEARGEAMRAEIAANEIVTAEEAAWLVDRIGRDGVLHDNERALLRFIRQESPDIHEALRPLLNKAG